MNQQRRIFLQSLMVGGATVITLGSGVLVPRQALATWSEAAFTAKSIDATMQALFAGETAEVSADITLKAPDIAENGAVVPISVKTSLANAESISILVENNPAPLAASYELTADSVADVSTRLKMGKTSNVIAIVKADGKLYSASREVKVTIGGCGG